MARRGHRGHRARHHHHHGHRSHFHHHHGHHFHHRRHPHHRSGGGGGVVHAQALVFRLKPAYRSTPQPGPDGSVPEVPTFSCCHPCILGFFAFFFLPPGIGMLAAGSAAGVTGLQVVGALLLSGAGLLLLSAVLMAIFCESVPGSQSAVVTSAGVVVTPSAAQLNPNQAMPNAGDVELGSQYPPVPGQQYPPVPGQQPSSDIPMAYPVATGAPVAPYPAAYPTPASMAPVYPAPPEQPGSVPLYPANTVQPAEPEKVDAPGPPSYSAAMDM